MNTSYLTPDEVAALQSSGLHRDSPYLIIGVSTSQLSIARHYGACKVQGYEYFYNPVTDELIRYDVLKWIGKERKRAAKERVKSASLKQKSMF